MLSATGRRSKDCAFPSHSTDLFTAFQPAYWEQLFDKFGAIHAEIQVWAVVRDFDSGHQLLSPPAD